MHLFDPTFTDQLLPFPWLSGQQLQWSPLSQGLAAPQLAQVLVNYWACIKHIFANGYNYPNLPEIHQCPATWGGTFFRGLIMAIHYLTAPEMVAAWAKHHRGPPDQGQRLTMGFLHHVGLLIRIFYTWIDTAECNSVYCQLVIVVDPDNPMGLTTKEGYVFAINKSEHIKYKDF